MPDTIEALIAKTAQIDGMWSKEQIARHAGNLADALSAAHAVIEEAKAELAMVLPLYGVMSASEAKTFAILSKFPSGVEKGR